MPRSFARRLLAAPAAVLAASLSLLTAPAAVAQDADEGVIRIGPDLSWPLPTEKPSSRRSFLGSLTIYQVNTRQATEEGTFDAFREQHLDRLQRMGVGVLWFMPIHPIGEQNRKGSLGSPYSVRDYYEVNPELGTLEDFQELVEAAHERGMLVIMDWVPNHTAWDHEETIVSPEWWKRDADGSFQTPNDEWTDVIQLDHRRFSVRNHLQLAMDYWVTEADIDGFRFDVAELLSEDHTRRWIATTEIKFGEKFFLAEGYEEWLYLARYDKTYDWPFRDLLKNIANREAGVEELFLELFKKQREASNGRFRMLFTSNHDLNAWEGSAQEVFGDAAPICAAMTFFASGMPMLYSGQEAANADRLEFFERDPIQWKDDPIADVYRGMALLKRNNSLLSHTTGMGAMARIKGASEDPEVLALSRSRGNATVLFVGNFDDEPASATIARELPQGTYYDAISGEAVEVGRELSLDLEPWGFRVLFNEALPYPRNPELPPVE